MAFLFPCVWVAAAHVALRFPRGILHVGAFLTMSVSIAAMDVVMHEAAHGLLFRRKAVNRWMGFLFGLPGLLSLSAYRVYHLRHHRQPVSESAQERWINGTPLYILAVPWLALRDAGPRLRRKICLEYSLLAAASGSIWTIAVKGGFVQKVIDLWIFPLVVAVTITSIRGWTETAAATLVRRGKDSPTRGLLGPLERLICDHLEHHLSPGTPWHDLPLLRQRSRAEYRLRSRSISYLRFLWNESERRSRRPVRRFGSA